MLNIPATPNISQEERAKLQKIESDRMFNFAEKWIMDYISYITDTKINDLFITPVFEPPHPVYTHKIKELDNAVIEFSLDIVECDYKLNIPSNLKDDKSINHVLGFIYHSIKEVFNAVINNNINKTSSKIIYDTSFHLEIADSSLTFYPIYIYPQKRKELLLNQMKDSIILALKENQDKLDKKTHDDMIVKYNQICKLNESINYDNDEAILVENEKNKEYRKYKRLGIKMNIIKLD